MAQGLDIPPNIVINGHSLEAVESFKYLGSTIANSVSTDSEVNSRIARVGAVMAKLSQRVWDNASLTKRTKLCVYKACVLSTLLDTSEVWITYSRHEKKLDSFHLRCLHRILRIRWQDKVPNTEVLERANVNSMPAIICERRMCWLGHVRGTKAASPKIYCMVN